MKKAIGALGLCFAVAALSVAVRDDAVTLKRVNKVGDVAKYKMSGNMTVQGGEAIYTASMSHKITKADPDGSATVVVSTSDVKISFGGQEMTPPDSPDQTITYDAKGEVVSITGGQDSGADTYRFQALNDFSYPEKAVKVGDTWTKERAANAKTGATAVKSDYTVAGREKIDTYDTLKITFKTKETGADGATIEGTAWMNIADGSLVKSDVTWTNVPVPGAPGPINGKITVTRAG